MAFFSIIVPIYGVESYLGECLDSILNQDFDDYEVIGIDDCTRDRSGVILDDYALRDPRIKPLHLTENVGLGLARNVGIEAATGDYLLFVDSDDTLALGSLAAMAAKLRQADLPDLLIGNFARVYPSGYVDRSGAGDRLATMADRVIRPQDQPELFGILPLVWNKAYKRTFVNAHALRFRSGYYEDVSFAFTALLGADTATTLDRIVLNYRLRDDGNILSHTSTKHFDAFAQYDDAFEAAHTYSADAAIRTKLYEAMVNQFYWILKKPDRLAKSDRRAFYSQASDYATKYQVVGGSSAVADPASRRWGALFRRNSYPIFVAYDGIDTARAGLRKFAGRCYWGLRAAAKFAVAGYYSVLRFAPLDPNLVVFAEEWSSGCNPRAIFDQMLRDVPHLKAVWVVTPERGRDLPPGTTQVTPTSFKVWWVFARGTYFVNNGNFPQSYVKRKGQVHIQTTHGTPLKYLGLDMRKSPIAAKAFDPRTTQARGREKAPASPDDAANEIFVKLNERVSRWDYALSSNEFSSDALRSGFPGEYKILEFGYPRNDRLVNATPADIAARRERLGITSDQTAVLYAPTFRELEGDPSLRIDFDELIKGVSDEFVFIVRAHYMAKLSPATQQLIAEGRIIDGSTVSEVSDLYLVADILITDYSSVMFDYAILNRPIVIFADDWDRYRNTRGTYFDLLESPPGAVARNQPELVEIFANLTYRSAENQQRLKEFHERFCAFDDGHAAERVVATTMLNKPDRSIPS